VLVELSDWSTAAEVLDAFRANHPGRARQRDVTRQMAHVQRSAGDAARAAAEYERIAAEAENADERVEALSVAAELHEEAGSLRRALEVLGSLVTEYTGPIERLVATRFKMAEILDQLDADREREEALRHVVALDAASGAERTARTRSLAGRAALALAEPGYRSFAEIELTQPFDASLARKRASLEQTLAAFEALVDYGVGEVTAAATFYLAETYGEFGRALIESERPGGLSGGERLDYEDILLEQAFPFEERAIEVHEKNLELARDGVANDWVEKSLARLGEISPGRYAKEESSAGPLTSIDRYVYRAPARNAPTPGAPVVEVAESTKPGPDAPEAAAPAETSSTITPPPAAPAPVQEAAP